MKNILVVDDNKLNLASARKTLSEEYKVIPVMRGEQALSYLEKGECDIILLDIKMPEMDGFEVLSRIRQMEHCKNIPVIFLTADSDTETETRCFREGAVDFIAKPFVPEVMLSRIGRVLEIEELRRSLADRLEKKTQEVSVIKNKSRQDPLTGLWNRAHTEETVNRLLAEGIKGALMMIDMDNFKAINDNYGHIAGDRTLKMFADTLRKFSAEGDVLCRIGGDEFVVFVRDVYSKSEVGRRASDIISDLCLKLEQCGFDTNSSVSIGISQTPEDGTDFSKLYNAADKALYHVKQNGKNSYHFFSDRLEAEKKRSSKNVDLDQLIRVLSRTDSGKGAYLLDYDSFNHVFNFIKRFVDRSGREVQTILFTVCTSDDVGENSYEETNTALEMLDKAIYTSLRRVDVSTRYSSKQTIVILMDANSENGEAVAGRIISCFEKLYIGRQLSVQYEIAKIEAAGFLRRSSQEKTE